MNLLYCTRFLGVDTSSMHCSFSAKIFLTSSILLSIVPMASEQSQSKRRRLDASSTLSKPFKSPLRTRDAPSHPPSSTPDVITTPKDEVESASSPPTSNADTDPFVSPRDASRPQKPMKAPKIPTPKRFLLADPEVLVLQKEQRSLQSRLATLRTELDNARQALRIESSNKAAELEGLILKWRLVSQEAADEVFAGARERVSKMGGTAAWRERSKQDAARWAFVDDDQVPFNEDDFEQTGSNEIVEHDHGDTAKQDDEAQDEVG